MAVVHNDHGAAASIVEGGGTVVVCMVTEVARRMPDVGDGIARKGYGE